MPDSAQQQAAPVPGGDVPAVELLGISKAYPGVVANDAIDLAVRRGEVHCLLGENGAGKSTLMSILAGMVQPDGGQIRVGGQVVIVDSPKRAIELGIGMVYQHLTLVPTLTVLENLQLGDRRPGLGGLLSLDAARARARASELAALLSVDVDLDATTGTLALGQQQQVEIVKALWRGSQVLILDEPTSMLTPQGVAELASVLASLKRHGLAVVLITHKLHEATTMGDRVSILRQGRLVGAIEPEELAARSSAELQDTIVRLMFGSERAPAADDVPELAGQLAAAPSRRRPDQDEPLLELDDLRVAAGPGELGVHGISLGVLPGEILGVAGVDGNGQRELAEAIAGQRSVGGGDVRIGGVSVARLGVSGRQKLGLRYVTDDRIGEGTVGAMSVGLNLVLKRIGQAPFWRRGRIRPAAVEAEARTLIDEFEIRTPGPATRVAALSGGNIQKVVLARELSAEPRIVVYNKPTYGLDIRTTEAIRARIRAQAEGGVTSLVISTDLEELLALCDRIAVLSRGRLVGVVDNGPDAERQVGALMVGGVTG